MRSTRARQCEGKKRHGSRAEAYEALWELVRRGAKASRLNVYQCPHCSAPQDAGWHLGHRMRRCR